MKVRATMLGFYGGKLRKEGDVFLLKEVEVKGKTGTVDKKATQEATERQFSVKWMEKA